MFKSKGTMLIKEARFRFSTTMFLGRPYQPSFKDLSLSELSQHLRVPKYFVQQHPRILEEYGHMPASGAFEQTIMHNKYLHQRASNIARKRLKNKIKNIFSFGRSSSSVQPKKALTTVTS